ncbi:MAG: outer membrane beta-barrel protein [Mariprofundaceae bacterium]|nr:outer membrane beta-barrel protein [Mariprofundaceae bacterium]
MNKTIRNTLAAAITLAFAAMPAQAGSIKDKVDNLQISGFVDTSWSSTNAQAGATSTGFGLDQIELDVEYSEGNVGMRFDLQSSGQGFATDAIEQGYVYVNFSGVGDDGTTFMFGKFNAPIGWELLDAPDMYQFSHALVFNEGLPTNLTGASLAATFGMFDANIYYADQVDTNGTTTTGIHSTGLRFGISPLEGANIGISYLNTTNPGNVADITLDIDFTYDAIDNLLIGGEYNQVKSAGITSGGYFGTVHYDFTEQVGLTYRYGTFDDDTSIAGKATSNTVALTSVLGGGLGALFEYRSINNTTATSFIDAPKNFNTKVYAFEMTYGF